MSDLDLGATIKGFAPGQKVFSRYTLTHILGRGGMGVVWLARDDKLERDVALKFLPEVMMSDKLALSDLKRETRRSLDLTHSHIVRIYDFVEDGRTAAIAMEFIDGETLTNARVNRPGHCYEPAELAKWVVQLCSALDYAHHKAKVVHRDLKPANLMVDAAGDLKITDFGIASSIADSVSRVSKDVGSSGTPVYMAPQQMMGEKPAVTDDVYSIGATLYDLLTGKPPFHSGNIILQVQSKAAPPLNLRRSELGVGNGPVPAEWEQTIAACLAKEPKDRPQSAGEVAERLGLSAKGNAQRSTSSAERPTKGNKVERVSDVASGSADPNALASGQSKIENRKSKMPMFAGLTAAVLVLGGLGWYFGVHAPEQKRLAEIARLEAEKRTEEANRLRTEQEKAAAETRARQEREAAEVRARQEQEAAAAKEQADREQREYAVIVARIDAFVDGSPDLLRTNTDTAVKNYLATAPARFRAEVERRWIERQSGWQIARLAAARGGIVVRTNPAGAEVRVGAIALEKSPLTLKEQKLGRYPVRIRMEGYEEWSGEVEVKENEFADLDVKLVRSTGRVVLTGTPGAVVTEGSRRLGTLPLTLDRLPTGPVRYTVSLEGHEPAELAGEVPRNDELRLVADLVRIPHPQPGKNWENSLGQKFVPVPGINALVCIWETRVQDFEAFVRATGHDATRDMQSLRNGSFAKHGDSWRNPGHSQGPTHPVVGVDEADVRAFCRWLTEKERREGRLAPDQEYRLPTDAEWDAAAGNDEFPWGNQWPPPPGAGNFADVSAKDAHWPAGWQIIEGYNDGYARTAPVGSFMANRYGIYDLAGNVWERVGDRSQGIRGASLGQQARADLNSRHRYPWEAGARSSLIGFRIVCALGSQR
jgi:serine/threonine protein kinase